MKHTSTHVTSRIDAVTLVAPAYQRVDPPPPKSVKISVTERCNHACGYCALRLRKHAPVSMDKDDYKRIVREAAEFGVQEIAPFYMGEPTMLPWLGEAVEIAKAHVPYVFLTTNGTYSGALNAYADCFIAGLDSLKFSLNYATAEQYSEVTGCRPELFKRLLRNIKAARDLRDKLDAPTKLWASAIQYDGEQAERMAEVIAEVEPFLDGPVYQLPLYSMASWATDRTKELGFKPTAGNQGRIGALRDPLPCWTCFTAAHVGITSTGRPYLSACCFDASGTWEMADLSTQSFGEAWHSLKFQALRKAHLAKDVSETICGRCLAYT